MEQRGIDRCTHAETGTCGLHELLEEEKREHRKLICSKINAKADKELNEQEHETMQADICEIKALSILASEKSLPIWVFKWIGGPAIAMVLAFTAWTAVKGFSYGDRLTRLEYQTEALLLNTGKIMEHFNITPGPVKNTK